MTLDIKGTRGTPAVRYNPTDKSISLTGRCIIRDDKFWEKVHAGIKKLSADQLVQTLHLNLEYINTFAQKQIFDILGADTEELAPKSLAVRWEYKEDDDGIHEDGKFYHNFSKEFPQIGERENVAVAVT